jgi:NACalpha-BTF3-like transcription factor
MNTKRLGTILLVAAMLVSAITPAAVTAQMTSLSVDVTQDDGTGDVTITVADNGTAVENATVNVTAGENDTYTGAGEYTADENGTVTLADPDEPVELTITAMDDGDTATTAADLTPPEPSGPFGLIVSTFVETLKNTGSSGSLGQQVSEVVTSNAPSNENASANASERGPPEGAGPSNDGNDIDDDGTETRVVPSAPPTESPGNSGDTPDQSGDDGDSEEDETNEEGESDGENESSDGGDGGDGDNNGGGGNGSANDNGR